MRNYNYLYESSMQDNFERQILSGYLTEAKLKVMIENNQLTEQQLKVVEELVQQMEAIIEADEMWENAMVDKSSRRVLAAAIGVVALKFGEVSDGMIDFLNNDDN